MANHTDCIHEEDFKRLEGLVEKVFKRMDDFIDQLHKANISDTNRQNKIEQLERDIDRAFVSIRDSSLQIKDISDWRQRFDGGVKIIVAVPVFCAVLTTVIAVYQAVN